MKTIFKPHCPCRIVAPSFFLLLWLISFLAPSASAATATTPLTILCPTNVTLWTCSSNTFYQYPAPIVSGGCSNYTVICQPPSGSLFPLGITTVTCRVFDGCQNGATCTFTVTVREDTEPPKIECPTNMLVKVCPTAAGGCAGVVNYPPPVASDNSGSYSVVCVPPSGSVFPCGTTAVNCRVEDRCGNKDECRFLVTVELGGAPPGIQCPADLTITTCSNTAVLTYPAPVVNPAGTTVTCNPPVGTIVPIGTIGVTCVAVNSCGTNTCTFKVTVRRVPPVSILCPTNFNDLVYTVPCGSNCVPVFYPAPVVVGGALIECNPPPGTCLPVGVHVVMCWASNQCERVMCEFPVRVVQGQGTPPQIICPNDLTVTTCSNCVPVSYPAPIVNNGTLIGCNPKPGTCLPVGVNTVTCLASNACGTNVCSFRITVRPVPPPVILCPTNPIVIPLPCISNCVQVAYAPPVVIGGTLIGCTPPPGGCLSVGDYVVTCRASNDCGVVVGCEFVVRVVPGQGQPPQITCPSNIVAWTCTNTGVVVNYPKPTVINGSDPNPTVTCVPPSGSVFPPGVTTVNCLVVDHCNNSNRCSFTVTVRRDIFPPDINCPSNIVRCVSNNVNGVVVNYGVTATDNADPTPTIVCVPPSGSFFPLGVTVVVCRATDDCGNESKCSFTVSVFNDRPPKLSIKREGRYVVICWPKTCACFKLQYTRNLNRPIVWTDVAVAPEDNGDSWCVTIPFDNRHRFFRLISCDSPTAPVFDVTGVGITPAQAGRLAEALDISHDGLVMDRGALLFIDPLGFQSIPTKPITDPALIEELAKGSENDKGELTFEGIDFGKLREIRAIDGEKAMDLFAGALRAADLLPANGDPVARHSLFEATDPKGEPTMPATPIDTQVEYNFELGGVPLIGPGAKLSLALSPEGKPTALHFMTRQVKPAQEIPILSLEEAARRCAALYPKLRSTGTPRLVYYAPSLQLPAVQKIIPCYECGGSAPDDDQQLQLLRAIIPATDDPALVPSLVLDASAKGTLINAKATVEGGTPPYTYEWSSSSTELSFPPDASSIEYNARPRADAVSETVKVLITDANGMTAQASRTLPIDAPGFLAPLAFTPAVGGVTDYGCERGVSDLCAAQQAAFNARFAADGIFRRFNWAAATAWERDFKEGPTGLDHLYVDNVDMTFYMGHGSGAGFTFENNNDDTQVHYNDVVGAWGDVDLEWLALLSCSVIADTHGGKTWAQRWGPAFSGLHLMLGFANTAYDEAGFGGAFANWTLGYQIGFVTLPPMPVRSAWFLAHDGHQPASVYAAAMGVIGPSGISNYNDYFWGKGSVGPDIRGAQIHGYWRVKHD